MKTQIYHIKSGFAKRKGIPILFAAIALQETARALYVYGNGTAETTKFGICSCCGRELTHPVSVELGIGPICGGHYHNWDAIGGFTMANIERLKGALKEIKVDTWIPKAVIKRIHPSETLVSVPKKHLMLQPKEPMNPKATTILKEGYTVPVIKITFPFNYDDLATVKSLEGRRYHSDGKFWTCIASMDNINTLQSAGWTIAQNIKDLVVPKVKIASLEDKLEIPGLRMTMFPYQYSGVNFIDVRKGRALLGDEMGLGKTAQALGWLQLHPEKSPVIIVVPASLKLNWQKEALMWMDKPNIEILSGTKIHPLKGEIIILNYDILYAWIDMLLIYEPKVLILDESHYIKSNKAKRTKAVKKLAKKIPHLIALSGTPIVNRPIEFYNVINLVDPTLFPDGWAYAKRYCGAKHNGYGWDFNGATNTKELHEKLNGSIMIRRKKIDVLKELPAKLRSLVPMELDNVREYSKAESNFISWLRDTRGEEAAERAGNAEALAAIEALKQLSIKGKMKDSIDWISTFLESDEKLVVFATHKMVIDRLMEEFKTIAVKIDGSVDPKNRQKAVDAFQEDPNIRLFIGNIKAAGVGITLTAASNVAFLELPWTPGDLNQAEDRVHRIGQVDSVTVYYLLAQGTIEERIARLLDNKRKVLDAVLDGQDTEDSSLLSELMSTYKI